MVLLSALALAIFGGALLARPKQVEAAPYYYGSYGGYNYFGGYGYYNQRSRRLKRKRRLQNRYRRKKARRSIAKKYSAPKTVAYDKNYEKGAIVVDTSERKLYYITGKGIALQYSVAVGKPHMQWFGKTFVQLKRKNPGWTPTARMRREGAPRYVPPGPNNPLGVRAINLGWSEYRIHGTNAPGSIGGAVSSGCIRMRNHDVVDLFNRVHVGAPVYVIR